MKKIICTLMLITTLLNSANANYIPLGSLPVGNASSTGDNDSFPFTNVTSGTTQRILFADMPNIPALANAFAPIDGTVSTVGVIDSQTKSANGAVITGPSLVMQTADPTHPGLISNLDQNFAGKKTFNNNAGIGATAINAAALIVGGTLSTATSYGTLISPFLDGGVTSGFGSNISLNISGTLTTLINQNISTPAITGSIGNQAGLAIASMLGATNNIDLLLGTSTIPSSGNYGIYQGDSYSNFLAGPTNFSSTITASSLTASEAVVTDGSKNLTSMPYSSAAAASSLVQRDGAGSFSATTVTANLTGTASGNTTYTANNHGLVVSSSSNAMTVVAADASTTKVLKSGGSSSDPSWLSYDNANSANTLVFRDGSGNFNATTITAALTGTASGNTTISPSNHAVALSSATNALSTAAPSATTGVPFTSNGSSADPSFSAISLSNSSAVSGILPNANTTADSANTASAIVARDGSGNFSAGTITATLNGTASGNISITPANHAVVLSHTTNTLATTGPFGSTGVPLVSNGAAADPAFGALDLANGSAITGIIPNANTTASSANTGNAIVTRDGSGNFAAQTITANLTGTASGNTTITPVTHAVPISSGTNALTSTSPSTAGVALVSNGASADPSFGALNLASGSAVSGVLPNANTTATSANTASTIIARDGSGNFSAGTITGTTTGNTTYTASNHGVVVSGSGNAMTVIAAPVSSSSVLASNGTGADPSWFPFDNANTGNTLVQRDVSGNFSASTITAALTGTASGNTTITPANHAVALSSATNALSTAAPSATSGVALISNGASSDPSFGAINLASGTAVSGILANANTTATNANTASSIVSRDGSGNFAANVITATLNGNANTANTAINVSGSFSGDVTGTQSAMAISSSTVTGKSLTGFVSGAGTVTASDTILTGFNKLDGNVALKAPLANPTFTGTVTIPSPFTLGATSMTSTGTQLNYLNASTGTTGTTSTNVVFSGSPTLATPTFSTSATTPLVIGGAGASSTLTLESTSGAGTTDSVIVKSGSQSTRATWFSNGGLVLGSGAQVSSSPGAGELGFANGNAIRWLNGAGSAYLNTIAVDSSNNLMVGGGGAINDAVFSVGGVGTALTLTNTSGLVEVAKNLVVDQTYSSPGTTNSTTTASQSNVTTVNSFMQFTGNATITIHNLAAGVKDGQRFTIINNTTNTMSFPYNDSTGGGSVILNSTGATITLGNNGMLDFMYSTGHNGSNWYISGK